MSYGELNLGMERPQRNALTGRFLPGHEPANKGKKWSEYMSKRAQKRADKGWKNLEKYRPKTRPDNAGRSRKQVIAVMDDGAWLYFASVSSAAAWIGRRQEIVGRCCRLNQSRRVNRFTGKVNTDHRYLGVRFYFEDDDIWTTKIK